MEKLLNLTRKQVIVISWTAVGVGIAGLLAMGLLFTAQAQQANQTWEHEVTAPADSEKYRTTNETPPASKPVATPQPAQVAPKQAEPVTKPIVAENAPAPTKKTQGAHIPFTTKPVTPGDSESYIDTVGQCPFYEMGGPKGCVPPPNLECNDDWTVCNMVEDTAKDVKGKVGL